jgi:hypothetical protein
MDGVWIDPVMAQVMMTLPLCDMMWTYIVSCALRLRSGLNTAKSVA